MLMLRDEPYYSLELRVKCPSSFLPRLATSLVGDFLSTGLLLGLVHC